MDYLFDSKKVDVPALMEKGCLKGGSAKEIKQVFDKYTDHLTDALIKHGYLASEKYFAELADQLGVQFIDSETMAQHKDLAAAFPHRLLKRNSAFPVSIDNGQITIATSNPFNSRLVTEMSDAFPEHDIKLGIAAPEDISA